MNSYAITFLLDSSNNWLEPYLKLSFFSENSEKYAFSIAYEPDLVQKQDVVFILGYTKILSDDFLAQNCLNLVVHESDLPKGKGFSPVQWQILEGMSTIPVCLIEAVPQVDAGDIVGRHHIHLTGDELYAEIRDRQAEVTIELIANFLQQYPAYNRESQIGSESNYPRRRAVDSELDMDLTLRDQFNLFRIVNNDDWPAFFVHNGQKYILKIYKE